MKAEISISQEELFKIVSDFLKTELAYVVKLENPRFNVEWDQQYDSKPTSVSLKFDIEK